MKMMIFVLFSCSLLGIQFVSSQTIDRDYLCNKIMWGTYVAYPWDNGDDMTITKAVDKQFSRASQIVHWYANWDDGTGDFLSPNQEPKWLNAADSFTSYGSLVDRTPMVTWQPWKNPYGPTNNFYTPASIVAGNHDTYINNVAKGLKTYGKQMFLRPFHEFDGNWYPWGSQNNNAQSIINAWKYIHGKFKAAGASNVLFVWCPNHSNGRGINQEDYYPGDEYVDWVCFDVYSEYSSVTFAGSVGQNASPVNPYARVTAKTNKPMMIAEFGVEAKGTTPRSEWFKQLAIDLPTKLPQIKALVFFNSGNYKIDPSDTTTSKAIADLFGGCDKLPTTSSKASTQSVTSSTRSSTASNVNSQSVTSTRSSTSSNANSQTVTTTPNTQPVTSPPTPLPDSYLYYSFDKEFNGTIVQDDSENGRNGLVVSSPSLVEGKVGKGMNFRQNRTDVQTLRIINGNTLSGSFTAAFWMKLSSNSDTRMKVFSSKPNWNAAVGWQLEVYPTLNSISLVGSADSVAAWQGLSFVYNEWTHVAVTVSNSVATLYLNGAPRPSQYISPVQSSTTDLYLASDGTPNAFSGVLDEVYLLKGSIEANQITQLMNSLRVSQSNIVVPLQIASDSALTSASFALLAICSFVLFSL